MKHGIRPWEWHLNQDQMTSNVHFLRPSTRESATTALHDAKSWRYTRYIPTRKELRLSRRKIAAKQHRAVMALENLTYLLCNHKCWVNLQPIKFAGFFLELDIASTTAKHNNPDFRS